MHPEKKITKEDTWRTDDLKRHIRVGSHDEDNTRRRDRAKREEQDRRQRSGESLERRQQDQERDARRERDKARERDGTRERDARREKDGTQERERTKHRASEKERDQDRRRDGTMEKDERERERRKERERDRGVDSGRYRDGDRESRERKYDRAEKENRDREKDRERERNEETDRDKDKEKERDREREKRRAEKRRERDGKREEDREGGRDRDRLRSEEKERDREKERERRERHRDREYLKESEHYKDGQQEKRRERERNERHSDREQRDDRGCLRKEKEERETRRRAREHHGAGENRKADAEARQAEREPQHRERKESEGRLPGDRDRDRERDKEERDKRRERRHREGSDPGRDPAKLKQETAPARKRSDRPNRDQREARDMEVENEEIEIEKQSADDYGNEEYEEDFEKMDYEEDFEDEDEDGMGEEEGGGEGREELGPQKRHEIETIQRAMAAENERAGSAQSRPRTDERPTRDSEARSHRGPQHGRIIDFVAAKRREISEKVANKQKKRSAELLRLIDLDFSITFSLLDLPPVNEYDMYIKNFGTTNTKQAYVQCNEDNTDRDIQTDETEMSDRWTQHPAERNVACGGPSLSHEALTESMAKVSIDSQRLASFLRSATQVVAVLLEEDRAESHSLTRLKSQTDSLSFSDGCLQLNTKLPFLHGRQISLLQVSPVQRQTLLSVHAPSPRPSAVRLDTNTIICIWNIWEPSRPQRVLLYESELRCCCFSPGKATLVFAGTAVGSVVLWDLREHSSAHYNLRIGEDEWTLRYPTFSTDAVLSGSGHLSSVRSVEPVTSTIAEGLRPERPLLANQEESLGLSFQLASLDENGLLNLWVVVELPKASEAGSQTDLGLRPGGKVKLLHSSSLLTCERSSPRDSGQPGPLQALLLKFLPSDSNHYFIGTNMGLVNHGSRHGLKTPHKLYRPQGDSARPVDVSSVDFSPSGEPFFLVGCADGSVRLHCVLSERPVMEWSDSTGGEPVVSARWALTRPAVFCVLDAASRLHVWDLLESNCQPVITESLHTDPVTAVAAFGDPANQNAYSGPANQNAYSGPANQNAYSGLALAKQSGKIEIQYFNRRFTVPDPADAERLRAMMQDAF